MKCICLCACSCLLNSFVSATVIEENWNYPSIPDNTPVEAGSGFSGGSAWFGSEWKNESTPPKYRSDRNLNSNARGWVNRNAADSGSIDGPTNNNADPSRRAYRTVSETELDGTVYLAFLIAGSDYGNGSLAAVFFDGDNNIPGKSMGLSFFGEAAFCYTASPDESVRNRDSRKGTFGRILESAVGGTPVANLVIAKFETDYNAAGHDRVTCILNPLIVTSEALALQTAAVLDNAGAFTYDPGTDLWGSGIHPELAISMRQGSPARDLISPIVDQIRIASGPDAWAKLVAPEGQPPVTPEPGGITFLDGTVYDFALDRSGSDPLENDVLFVNETDSGAPIVIDGNTPEHGFYARETKVELTYFVTEDYSGFAADAWYVNGTPSFQVVGDGDILYDSGYLPEGERRRIVVDISDVTELRIVFAGGGDGITNDRMSLGNPRLIKKPVINLNIWEQWRATHFPDALNQPDLVSGPEAPSGGTPNAIRFALQVPPEVPITKSLPSVVDGRLQMSVPTFAESGDLLDYWVQVSEQLTPPSWSSLEEPPAETDGAVDVRIFRDSGPDNDTGTRFMRFKTVFKNPVARIETNTLSGIAPLTVSFDGSTSSSPVGIFRYNWKFGDGTTEPLLPAPTHTFDDPGVYQTTLEVYDDEERVGVSRVMITVLSPENQPPAADITTSSRLVSPGSTVTFDASSSNDVDGSITSYLWDFGGGDTATGQMVARTFNSTGFAPVTLTVTDDDGATASASTRVRIDTGDNSTIFPIGQDSRILFIGNSLISFFGPMRDSLNAVTEASTPSFTYEPGGAGKGLGILLEYATWPSLNVESIINQGWDIVIIQPWTDVLENNLSSYETSADTLVGWVRASGAYPILFSPHTAWEFWPTDQPTSRNVIAATAARLDIGLIEANAAWNQVLADYPMDVNDGKLVNTSSNNEFKDLLYSDGVHQNANGMALNTYLVYKYLTGMNPEDLDHTAIDWPGGMGSINDSLQPYFQTVAEEHGTVSPFID